MAAVSDCVPSPGAPVTEGTTAINPPARAMLPVVGAAPAAADLLAAGPALGAGSAGVGRESLGCPPTPTGCPTLAVATLGCPLWVGSQVAKELAAFSAMARATGGVTAAQGSFEALPEISSSPVMRLTRRPAGSVTSQM